MKTRLEISAGGVIYRRKGKDTEVCLIATHGGDAWQLPKGFIEEGEQPEEAARREVGEETGLQGDLLQPLEKIEYWYVWDYGQGRERVHKFVHFFLFSYTSGSTDDHDDEVEEARWLPLAEALKHISFKNERHVLELAIGVIAPES